MHIIHSLQTILRKTLILLDMNYVSAVYGVVVFIIVVDWFARGKHNYRGQTTRHEEIVQIAEDIVRRGSVG